MVSYIACKLQSWRRRSASFVRISPPRAPRRVADWFAHLNNKMGGDMKKIQVGRKGH